jgi:hypothetical protein
MIWVYKLSNNPIIFHNIPKYSNNPIIFQNIPKIHNIPLKYGLQFSDLQHAYKVDYCKSTFMKPNISLIMRTPVVWNKRLKSSEPTPKISCQNSKFKVLKVSWKISEHELITR